MAKNDFKYIYNFIHCSKNSSHKTIKKKEKKEKKRKNMADGIITPALWHDHDFDFTR